MGYDDRFEMPFNIWCGHCEAHIGKGVRYNARKKQIGMYFTSKLWEFSMTCHLCHGMDILQ
jgi:coiled-coil domain-containing protein 130